jgi:predicted nucleic acid-binding protein
MNFLLDTCALSELIKKTPNANFLKWISSRPKDALFISAITIAELWQGVVNLPASAKKDKITRWFLELKNEYGGHVLNVDSTVAEKYGELQGLALRHGKPIPVLDCLIAATALSNHLILVTRNVKDFSCAEVKLFNPWNQL